MTEKEWNDCTDPTPMLEFLRGKVSERKLRLFAVGCCRCIPGFCESEPDRQGLELTELDVDGEAQDDAFDLLEQGTWDIRWYRRDALDAVWRAMESYRTEVDIDTSLSGGLNSAKVKAMGQCEANMAEMLREITGYPFRPITINSTCLTPTVINLATTAYDERAFPSGEIDTARLEILADALEDAGCDNQDILEHLRSPGPHVRGCHLLDLILGKE